jgi:hypothetical protein
VTGPLVADDNSNLAAATAAAASADHRDPDDLRDSGRRQ